MKFMKKYTYIEIPEENPLQIVTVHRGRGAAIQERVIEYWRRNGDSDR